MRRQMFKSILITPIFNFVFQLLILDYTFDLEQKKLLFNIGQLKR